MLWRRYLLVGLAAVASYPFLPVGITQDIVYVAIGLGGVSAILFGVRHFRPDRRSSWYLMAAGQFIWVIGDAVSSWNTDIAHDNAFPSAADAFYLSAYPVLAVSLLQLIRGRRPRRDIAGVLDSATVTAGLGLLSWVLLARPIIDASQHSFAAAAVGAAYPIADIVLIGGLIRLFTTPGGRTPSFRLLLAAVALLVAGDTITSALSLYTASSSNAYDAIWLTSYVVWGTAALHPSMRTLSEPTMATDVGFSKKRLAVLTLAVLVAPGTLAVQQLPNLRMDVWAVVVGSVTMFLLVVGRMAVAIDQIVAANRLREKLQDDLAYQAAHDSLTGLPNRAQALRLIEGALHRAQRSGAIIAVLFVDLDGFKAVNDTFGHRAGDDVLCSVARRMQAVVRGGDVVARLGGDEFVVLLEPVDAESCAVEVADRLVDVVAQPMPVGAQQVARIGASVGVSISQDGSVDPEVLLMEADTAVYRAKLAGRGRTEVFGESLRRELVDRADLETAIAAAIDNEEFRLEYQPIIALLTGDIEGYEALVRWDRPGVGRLQPNDFIPTAEESNLICDLDVWVLNRATRQLAEWNQSSGTNALTMAVNISGRHLSNPRILPDVLTVLASSGISARQLTLEVTETVRLDDPLAFHHLDELRQLGITISMDDFGTGYNSISRLQKLPVDVIKIDRSFLNTTNPASIKLLQLMVQTAHTFGLPVVAEGVEDDDQLAALKMMNCESAQGFLLGRPMAPEAAEEYRSIAYSPVAADVAAPVVTPRMDSSSL